MQFHYVYILRSESKPDGFYTGITEDLRARLAKHNAGGVPHTAKHRPWTFKPAIAFTVTGRLKTGHLRALQNQPLQGWVIRIRFPDSSK